MSHKEILIAPSLLASDFSKLGEEIAAVDAAGADWMHLDVMDGKFVPPISYGADVIKAMRSHTDKPFDTHLMVENPNYMLLKTFADAGSQVITVHQETCKHLHRTLQHIRGFDVKAGVSLNPATPVDTLKDVVRQGMVDLILLMSVNPGYGGQSFIDITAKIAEARALADASGFDIHIEVDGGINDETAKKCIAAGADVLVAGSYVFKGGPKTYEDKIKSLRG